MVDEEPCCLVMEFIYQVANAVAHPTRRPSACQRRLLRGALAVLLMRLSSVLAEALDPAEGALGYVSCICFGEPGDERPYPRVQGCYPVPFSAGLVFQVRVVRG